MTVTRPWKIRVGVNAADAARVVGASGALYCSNCAATTTQILQAGRSQSRSFATWRCSRCCHENRQR